MQKFKELGNTGLIRYGGYIFEDFMPDLRYPRAAKIYKEMASNDPTVGAILYTAEQLVRKASWRVEAGENTPIGELSRTFLQENMDDMSTTWGDTVSEILSMMVYGFSWHEIVYKKRNGYAGAHKSKYSDGKIGWAKISPRSQESLVEWEFNEETGSIKSMIQQCVNEGFQRTVPLEKSLLFRTKISRDNPEGRSLLRNAYRPWYFKKKIEEIEGIGIERDLAGLPVLVPPPDVNIWDETDQDMVKLKNMAIDIVTSVRRDSNEGLVLPNGWEFKLLSTGSKRQFDTNAIITRYDNRIAMTMLADIVILGSDKIGSFALADVKKGLLAASLETILDSITAIFNRYAVPQLFAFNAGFEGLKELPRIVHGEVETPNLIELASYIRALSGAQIPLAGDENLENYLREVASMPLKNPDRLGDTPVDVGDTKPTKPTKPTVTGSSVVDDKGVWQD